MNAIYKMTSHPGAKASCAFTMPGYNIWGSSVIKGDDGLYHMFASRIPRSLPFHPGWLVESEIVRAVSPTPQGPYEFVGTVLPPRGAEYWDGRCTHNPRVIKHNGEYFLFYMGSTHPFADVNDGAELTTESKWCISARANKRIGIATSKSLHGPWLRREEPTLPTKPGTFYSFLTSNPAPTITGNSKCYLIFKARSYNGNTHGDMTIGLAIADNIKEKFEVVNTMPLFSLEGTGEIEDPFLWNDENGFHLLAKDQRGTITGEPGSGVLAHSADCLNWKLYKHPQAYKKIQRCANMERCSPLFDENGRMTHMFFAVWQGSRSFTVSASDAYSYNLCLELRGEGD